MLHNAFNLSTKWGTKTFLKLLKVAKSQRVFKISSHLQKNEKKIYFPNLHIMQAKQLMVPNFFDFFFENTYRDQSPNLYNLTSIFPPRSQYVEV